MFSVYIFYKKIKKEEEEERKKGGRILRISDPFDVLTFMFKQSSWAIHSGQLSFANAEFQTFV